MKNPFKKDKPEPRPPWHPAPYAARDVAAIQALQKGEATPEQQARALKWIIESAANTYDLPYRPGEEGRRDTDFACGRQFVGYSIVKMLKLNPMELSRREDAEA